MSIQANKSKVLTFITGGLVLGLLMVLAFGGSQMASKQQNFLLFFEDSVSGLTPGSPVKFHGVSIGTVNALRLRELGRGSNQRVVALVQVDVENMRRSLGVAADLGDPATLSRLVHAGLRAKLEVLSYVQGTMYIDLNFYNDAAPPPPIPGELEAPVIPTVRSNAGDMLQKIETVTNALRTYDFNALAGRLNGMLDSAQTAVSDLDLGALNRRILRSLDGVQRFAGGSWRQDVGEFSATLKDYQSTFKDYDHVVAQQGAGMIGLSRGAREKVAAFDEELQKIHDTLAADGQLRVSVLRALQSYTDMARDIRELADQWEQQPSFFASRPDTTPPGNARRGGRGRGAADE